MALYAIGDLHLSFGSDKPMDIFGGAWRGYVDKIKAGLSILREEDTLILCGDTSWGMTLEESREDFAFLASFPGRKILVKGNHDYWWTTASKMLSFFESNGFLNFSLLHNNAYLYQNTALCGSRGWFLEEGQREDQKVLSRECLRVEMSLRAGLSGNAVPINASLATEEDRCVSAERTPFVFLHYPPLYEGYRCDDIVSLLETSGVKRCYFGHLHGSTRHRAIEGVYGGVEYRLISADHVNFTPVLVLA